MYKTPLNTFNLSNFLNAFMFDSEIEQLNKNKCGIITRPHNFYIDKNKDGTITKYILETFYTPWKSSDISCVLKTDDKGPKLTIKIGSEIKKQTAESINKIYHGISNKVYTLNIPLTGLKVKAEDISVTASDGMLRVEIPADLGANTPVNIPVNIPVKS